MPIRNITDRARMPRLGKIHLGVLAESANGKSYPRAIDHFACPPTLIEALRDRVPFCAGDCGVPPGPVELPIMFLSDEQERVASQWFRAYKAGVNLVCRGDGYRADAMLDRAFLAKNGGDLTPPLPPDAWYGSASKEPLRREIACLGEGYDGQPPCTMYASKKCRRLMMLQFAIPDAPGLGIYQLDTGSVNSILNVNGFIEYLGGLTSGRIAGIPLTLRVVPQEVTADGKKKTVHVLQLTSPFTLAQLAAAVQRPTALTALLPEPDAPDVDVALDSEGDDDAGVIEAEPVNGLVTNDIAAQRVADAETARTVAAPRSVGDDPASEQQASALGALWSKIAASGELSAHSAYVMLRERWPETLSNDGANPNFAVLSRRAASEAIRALQEVTR